MGLERKDFETQHPPHWPSLSIYRYSWWPRTDATTRRVNQKQWHPTFQQALEKSVNKYIPHKTAKSKDSLSWMTTELRKLMERRNRLYKRQKTSGGPKHAEEFKTIKHLVQKKKSRHAYSNYGENSVTPHSLARNNSSWTATLPSSLSITRQLNANLFFLCCLSFTRSKVVYEHESHSTSKCKHC